MTDTAAQCPYKRQLPDFSEYNTLQLPENQLHRCDSGNESDIQHSHLSSGNVSPACSDYGGTCSDYGSSRIDPDDHMQGTEALCRKHSEDSALGSSEVSRYESDQELLTPEVKVWPVELECQFPMQTTDHSEFHSVNAATDCSQDISNVSNNKDWTIDTDELQDDSETLSDISQHSHTETLVRRNSSDELLRLGGTSITKVQRQCSEGSSSTSSSDSASSDSAACSLPQVESLIKRSLEVRESVGSVSSLDNYFSRIEGDIDENCVMVDVSSVDGKHKDADDGHLERTDDVNGIAIASQKIKRRPYKERLSEKSLKLKLDVSKKPVLPDHDISPMSAPIGDEVDNLYLSYQSTSESECSSTLHTPTTPIIRAMKDPLKRWQALKGIMPFIDRYRKQKWVQLAGHQGSFETSSEDTVVLKKFCPLEHSAFTKLFGDPLYRFIPKYHGKITKEMNQYCELENLLHGFSHPSVMDCKIGIRTYLEEELIKAEKTPTLRKDLYDKMCKINPEEPTEQEHTDQGISKPRYMQWREEISSTSTLGFRIEGIKCSDGSSCINFKTSKDMITIKTIITGFTNHNPSIVRQYLDRLKALREILDQSPFFYSHELIGSSLLFVHDAKKASVWMIDFGKTKPLPPGVEITHSLPWQRGNHEDGYLVGLESLMTILSSILKDYETG